uniref:Uncharacterized protein n=1 Tax=Carcinus maenas virus 1 TaxID=2704945 RepID=A0A6G9HEN3_9VIRU|nr:hypothetical protein [Carcinus maenas virus 1]
MSCSPCNSSSSNNNGHQHRDEYCDVCNNSTVVGDDDQVLSESDAMKMAKDFLLSKGGNTRCMICHNTLICTSESAKADYAIQLCHRLSNDPNFTISNEEDDQDMNLRFNAVMANLTNNAH